MEAEAYDPSLSSGRKSDMAAKVPAPISSSYVAKDPTDIHIDKRVLGCGKFKIYEVGGVVLFRVKGSILKKKVLLDNSGIGLVRMKHKIASPHNKCSVYRSGEADGDSDANLLFTMKKSSVFQWNPSLEIHLTGKGKDDSEAPDFKVKGTFNRRNFKIFYGDQVVAEANKNLNAQSIFLCKVDYTVTIYPGVDQAFIASILITLDQMCFT